jgi:hypothetical protein
MFQMQRGRFKLQSTQWADGITRIHCHFADDIPSSIHNSFIYTFRDISYVNELDM